MQKCSHELQCFSSYNVLKWQSYICFEPLLAFSKCSSGNLPQRHVWVKHPFNSEEQLLLNNTSLKAMLPPTPLIWGKYLSSCFHNGGSLTGSGVNQMISHDKAQRERVTYVNLHAKPRMTFVLFISISSFYIDVSVSLKGISWGFIISTYAFSMFKANGRGWELSCWDLSQI